MAAEERPDSLLWHDPAWLGAAKGWVEQELERAGLTLAGPMEQPHAAWWSTVLRVPTSEGTLWFKAVRPDAAFEPRLTSLLAAMRPRAIAEVVAADHGRGWMITRDAGTRLRDMDGDVPVVDRWAELLPRYAELQIDVAAQAAELRGLGVPEMSLPTLQGELRAALQEPDTILLDRPAGLSSEERRQLTEGLPAFDELCDRLVAFGIPDSIQHDDLHDGNGFLRDGEYVFFDWGDACIAHPFHTLVVTLRALAYGQKWTPGGAEITRLRDAYLEAWTGRASRVELVAASELARRTGTVQRALAWRRYALPMPPAIRAESIGSVPYGLRLYLWDGPHGSWDDGTF